MNANTYRYPGAIRVVMTSHIQDRLRRIYSLTSMFIPSTDQYVGGKFVIVDNTGSRNITGTVLTVDAGSTA